MPTLTGEGQKVFMVAVPTFHPGKAVAQVAAIQIPVDDFPEVGPEESIGPLKPLFIPLYEGFKMILDATVIIGSLRISGPINCGWDSHDSSPQKKTGRPL